MHIKVLALTHIRRKRGKHSNNLISFWPSKTQIEINWLRISAARWPEEGRQWVDRRRSGGRSSEVDPRCLTMTWIPVASGRGRWMGGGGGGVEGRGGGGRSGRRRAEERGEWAEEEMEWAEELFWCRETVKACNLHHTTMRVFVVLYI